MFCKKQKGHKCIIRQFLLCIFICCNGYTLIASPEGSSQKVSTISSGESIKQLKKAAAQGNVDAQYDLGYIYYYGQGVTRDYKEAFKWYKEAAIHGDIEAQVMVGYMYQQGRGIAQNYGEAFKYYKQASLQGSEDAKSRLGYLYQEGLGVKQDYQEAVK